MQLAIVNPRRKRRKSRKVRRARARKLFVNPRKRRRSRRKGRSVAVRSGKRRSSVARRGFGGLSVRGALGSAKSLVRTAAPAAVGAVALDVLWAYLPLPAQVRAGYAQFIAKGAGAVALGMVAEKFLGREIGSKFALGAMTVVIYNLARTLVGQFAPGIALAGGDSDFPSMGYYGTAPTVGEYNVSALPSYYGDSYSQTGNFQGVGEYVDDNQ